MGESCYYGSGSGESLGRPRMAGAHTRVRSRHGEPPNRVVLGTILTLSTQANTSYNRKQDGGKCGDPVPALLIVILVANSKSGERYHKKSLFSLLGGEYQPPLMLETNRTSLRKSNSPPMSHASSTHHRA